MSARRNANSFERGYNFGMQMIYDNTRKSPRGGATAVALGGFIVLALLVTFVLDFQIARRQAQVQL
jgi:hypothetical protein